MAGNLIVNPGFELGPAGWTLGPTLYPWEPPLAAIVNTPVASGAYSCALHRALISLNPGGGGAYIYVSGSAEQSFATIAGHVYPVSVSIYSAQSSGIPLGVYVNTGSGYVLIGQTGGTADWYLYALPSFTAIGTSTAIKFQPMAPQRAGTWYIDDVLVGPEAIVAKHRHAVVAEMVTVLKGITGSSYWSSLASRVYTRFRAPSEIGETEFPILFVIETPVKSDFRNDDHVIKSGVTLRIVGYARETSTDPLISNATATINKLRDDVMKVLLGNLKLNGKLGGSMLFQAEEFDYGVDPIFAGFYIDVRCPYYFTAADLGPLAT